MPTTTTKALVLSGGGTAGGAWMLGLIDGLRRDGIDFGKADLIVGTSAGARIGATFATGALDEAIGMYRRLELPPIDIPGRLDQFLAEAMPIIAEFGDTEEAARRISNLEPLGGRLASETERTRMMAAHLPVRAWPEQRLVITAVDAESGRRVAFDADSGVELLDAVVASGAVPGVFPQVEINGRRYADGAVQSLYNADLAAGHAVVTVISPLPLDDYLQGKLDSEIAELGSAQAHVIVADESSLAAIGPNPLSSETAAAALEAGVEQAQRESDSLRSMWGGR